MKIAITGGHGFLGWHTASRLRALSGVDAVRLGREHFADPQRLATSLAGVDAVLHLAGVNRAGSDEEVEQGNVALARELAKALRREGRPIDVVYANSVQAELDNPYGRGKAAAAAELAAVVQASGGHLADLLLPNLFGEHGRPAYNSFVATFAHEVAAGRRPTVTGDREVPLLHAQDAARELLDSVGRTERRTVEAEPRAISEVLTLLEEAHTLYATRGEIPPLPGRFEVNLFNTYRAAAFPAMWPLSPQVHSDNRGDLFETVRSHGGTGQSFVSTTLPGQMRGDHYHLHKVERFFVLKGEAEIRLRRLLHDEVVTFRLSGERPSFVDMPTLWVHDIRNVGSSELVTMFWADQLLDPDNPDQYPEKVALP
ncbi:NAD-dependent epimerase/dehydratase family protein [Nocardioides sp. cx-173]|uniref:polysaccharide biosynthesis C-terminal domain-containing protein n=1 Tax=Nocardioides sp. cx-173 TaxID=2898796 RepID=UPI001E2E92EE|nr:NAD-dependent epimerase/dehydratase family protein [Nocardioides sp. cx-173]MCD4523763.1 NAD-dependent epimerase/dehydratase family protein [Nocardioides sp. cx-173]UGB41913.1 NAD-dependent epimerase/dehydratase family protein [Nocardioides sp. cx-173]